MLLAGTRSLLAEQRPAPRSPKAPHRASVTAGLDCAACHTPAGWKSLGSESGAAKFDHSKTGFPLTQRHRQVACTSCHRSDQPLTRRCAGCHEDEHQGRLGAACDDCHSATGWRTTAAIQAHRQTRLPLTGMHALTECRDCHERTSERAFRSPPADCFACHSADYRRVDVHPPHVGVPGDPERPPFSRDCTQCHHPTGWVPAFVPAALVAAGFSLRQQQPAALNAPSTLDDVASRLAHDRVFPISRGPHRGADCAACHVSSALPRATRCTGCHAHEETQLRRTHREVMGYGRACLSCHPGGSVR